MKQSISLELGEFALYALGEDARDDAERAEIVPARVVRAIRYYLCDTNSDRIEWPYPGFLPDEEEAGERVTLELEIDSAVWSDFKREAGRQGVPPQRLAQHAVLYFVADRDAGRITQRILDDLADD